MKLPAATPRSWADLSANFKKLRAAVSGDGSLRVVRGGVTSAGAVAIGVGFTAARTGAGLYTITFTRPFTSVPSLVAMCRGTAGALTIKQAAGSTPTASQWFLESFLSTTGVLTDSGFEFIACGPD